MWILVFFCSCRRGSLVNAWCYKVSNLILGPRSPSVIWNGSLWTHTVLLQGSVPRHRAHCELCRFTRTDSRSRVKRQPMDESWVKRLQLGMCETSTRSTVWFIKAMQHVVVVSKRAANSVIALWVEGWIRCNFINKHCIVVKSADASQRTWTTGFKWWTQDTEQQHSGTVERRRSSEASTPSLQELCRFTIDFM